MTYLTRDEMKYTLELRGANFDDDVTRSIAAAVEAIDNATERSFATGSAGVARYYTPTESSANSIEIDDLLSATTVKTDSDGSGSFETTWSTTDYNLAPYNAALKGWPYTELEVSGAGRYAFPVGVPRSVEITGQWGWTAVPADIKQAATLLAGRLFKRGREAPFGVAGLGIDNIAVRIAKDDPDIQSLLEPYVRGGGLLVA